MSWHRSHSPQLDAILRGDRKGSPLASLKSLVTISFLMANITVQDVAEAGVVGAGGAGFPTHVKLAARDDTLTDQCRRVRTAAAQR